MFIEVEQIYHPDMMNFYFKADNEPQMYASYADFENKGEGLTKILMNLKGSHLQQARRNTVAIISRIQ